MMISKHTGLGLIFGYRSKVNVIGVQVVERLASRDATRTVGGRGLVVSEFVSSFI